MDELLNAEFKEAFDEFDKVQEQGALGNFASFAKSLSVGWSN